MFTGFTYKGIHTSKYGIISKTKNRPILPAQKTATVAIQNADSQYDFSSSNAYGRPFYEDRIFEMELLVEEKSITELQNKLSSVAIWLMGNGKLVFDDMPYVVWNANVLNGVDFAPKIYGLQAIVSVQFRVKPWSESIYSSEDIENITLAEAITLDSGIRIGTDNYFNFELTSGSNTITVENIGTYYARPALEFTGQSDSLIITAGDKNLTYNQAFTNLCVDLEQQYFKSGDALVNKYSSGEFFELVSGDNVIEITVTDAVSMKVVYTPNFIYNNPLFGGE